MPSIVNRETHHYPTEHGATTITLTRSASNLANIPLVVVNESDLKRFLLNLTAALTDDIMRAPRDMDMTSARTSL